MRLVSYGPQRKTPGLDARSPCEICVKRLRIGEREIGEGRPCFIVAEIGLNHDGDPAKAAKMIEVAAICGVDAVKLQRRRVDAILTRAALEAPYVNERSFGATYGLHRRALELPDEAWLRLKERAEGLGLGFFATPYDPESAAFLAALDVPAVKVASCDVTNPPLLDVVARMGVPVFLSTGMSTEEEIDQAVRVVWRHTTDLVLMHCVSSYPASNEELNLRYMRKLRKHWDSLVGYCLTPETRILTADMRWIPVSKAYEGLELVGFDEELSRRNTMTRAIVTGISHQELPCRRIVTSRGTVVASDDHQWVVSRFVSYKSRTGRRAGSWRRRWITTSQLKIGDRISHFVEPWQEDYSYDAGWLAGFFDGEGYISSRRVCVSQNPGVLLDRARTMLSAYRFTITERQASGQHGSSSFNAGRPKRCRVLEVNGRRQSMRFLGTVRPTRLLEKADRLWCGIRSWSTVSWATVEAIESVGLVPTVGLQTTSGTLIAEGLFSHNSGHERGIATSIAALVLGASVIERHFTLDRSLRGPDHSASLEPEGLRRLVRDVRNVEAALVERPKAVLDSEKPVRARLAKSLATCRRIDAGEVIERSALCCKGPGTGLSPLMVDEVVGRHAKRAIPADVLLEAEMLR